MNHKALYAGSFDPFTNGHLDIVNRGLKVFDEIRLLIAVSPSKKFLIDPQRRVELINEHFAKEPRITVDSWDGLLVEYAKKNKFNVLIRGLRPTGDFESEFQMASMNRKLNNDIETVFFTTGEKLYYISSSLVKEVHSHGGDISEFVPPVFIKELKSQ